MKTKTAKKNPQRKDSEILKIIKFAVIGFLSTLVELVVFYFLQNIVFSHMKTQPIHFFIFSYEGPGYMWSYIISAAVGYIISFIVNRKYTFHADANPVFSVFAYIIMVLFTILLTTWLGLWAMKFFIANNNRSLGETITKPIVALLAIVWTYPINRFIIHRKKKGE